MFTLQTSFKPLLLVARRKILETFFPITSKNLDSVEIMLHTNCFNYLVFWASLFPCTEAVFTEKRWVWDPKLELTIYNAIFSHSRLGSSACHSNDYECHRMFRQLLKNGTTVCKRESTRKGMGADFISQKRHFMELRQLPMPELTLTPIHSFNYNSPKSTENLGSVLVRVTTLSEKKIQWRLLLAALTSLLAPNFHPPWSLISISHPSGVRQPLRYLF